MAGILTSALADNADAVAAGSVGAVSIDRLTGFNGSTYDRVRMLGSSSLDGLGQLSVSPAVPTASVVKTFNDALSVTSTRQTLLTPTSGKRIRIVSWNMTSRAGDQRIIRLYFGTGAAWDTSTTSGIGAATIYATLSPNANQSFPDGGGPVGAADAVISAIQDAASGPEINFIIHYREE